MSGVMLSSAAATGFTVDWIVHPTTATHFLDHCWERQPHLVGRQDPAYFADLPRIDAVDELIVATAPTATRSRDDGHLVRTGPDGTTSHRAFPIGADGLPDIHSVYRGYSDGFSIVLNRVHRRSAGVALLCRRLERQLHHRVGANLYLTPRGAQGFRRHVDDHDVRLSSKKLILKLAARSMADPEFRARLVNDFPSLRAEMPADFAEAELPAGVDLNFLENTEHTLNIVLPRPLEAVAEQERPALRELLRSRTAAERSSFFQDDFRDHGNWYDWGPFMTPGDQGDVTRDAAVVLPE